MIEPSSCIWAEHTGTGWGSVGHISSHAAPCESDCFFFVCLFVLLLLLCFVLTEKSIKFCESTDVMRDRLVVKCLLHKHDLNSDPSTHLKLGAVAAGICIPGAKGTRRPVDTCGSLAASLAKWRERPCLKKEGGE